MNFELLDNGMDSLNSGLVFYEKFLYYDDSYEFKEETYLKLAVICIQNSIEILSMKVLTDKDEMIIYPKKFRAELEKIKNKIKGEKWLLIHDVLVNYDNDILTISYSKCIDLLKKIYQISDIEEINLKKLGKVRNQLTHLGLVRGTDYQHILLTINSALDFLVEFFYPKLKDERFEEMDLIYETAQNLFEEGEEFAHDVWAASRGFKFYEINKALKLAYSDLKENEKIESSKIVCNLLIDGDVESNQFVIEFNDSKTGKFIDNVLTLNFPRVDATFLVNGDDASIIYAIIDHATNETELYIYNKPLVQEVYEEYYQRFWLNHNTDCYRVNISKESFKVLIETLMRNLIKEKN